MCVCVCVCVLGVVVHVSQCVYVCAQGGRVAQLKQFNFEVAFISLHI